jgi:uncharacterized protein YbjQ (UPF0145 family)
MSDKKFADWTCKSCATINESFRTACNNCGKHYTFGVVAPSANTVEQRRLGDINDMPIVTVSVLPINARYFLIGAVNFQSTLGTGLFNEVGSIVSNVLGTEAAGLNSKVVESLGKCMHALKQQSYAIGGNAVIGLTFDISVNSRDAATVTTQGTAIFVENIDEVFRKPSR